MLDNCYAVQYDGRIGYLSKGKASPEKYAAPSGGGGGGAGGDGGEWTGPVM